MTHKIDHGMRGPHPIYIPVELPTSYLTPIEAFLFMEWSNYGALQ